MDPRLAEFVEALARALVEDYMRALAAEKERYPTTRRAEIVVLPHASHTEEAEK